MSRAGAARTTFSYYGDQEVHRGGVGTSVLEAAVPVPVPAAAAAAAVVVVLVVLVFGSGDVDCGPDPRVLLKKQENHMR